jgi:two-component system, chemotaxis family, CheB/CheR fusion protein
MREGAWTLIFANRSKYPTRPPPYPLDVACNAGALVVAFRELGSGGSAAAPAEEGVVSDHERELRATKAQLKAAVSELDAYMEEAKSANEEMQSVNEELQTLNAELQNKNTALNRTNDDLENLLHSTQVATLFLDSELRIRKFTPAMTAIFHVLDGDIGRPITDIVSQIAYHDLVRDVEEVQHTLGVLEREVRLSFGGKTVFFCCASDSTAH